jgi:hypothetical protein
VNDERLEALLRAAGQSATPPREAPAGLAERVRGLQARRARNRKLAGGASIALVLLGVGIYAGLVGHGDRETADRPVADGSSSAPDPEAIKAEIARLDAEAQRRQQAVRKMILADAARRAIARVQAEQDAPSPLELVRIEREKTAFLLVDRAEQVGARAQGAAADEYRRVLELFPNTQAARVARERLNDPVREKGDL